MNNSNLPAISQTPAAIIRSIGDILLAYGGAGNRAPEDRIRLLQMYAEVCAAFGESVALRALDDLKIDNPSNPFAPTLTDLRKACLAVQKADDMAGYYERVRRDRLEREAQEAAHAAARR